MSGPTTEDTRLLHAWPPGPQRRPGLRKDFALEQQRHRAPSPVSMNAMLTQAEAAPGMLLEADPYALCMPRAMAKHPLGGCRDGGTRRSGAAPTMTASSRTRSWSTTQLNLRR